MLNWTRWRSFASRQTLGTLVGLVETPILAGHSNHEGRLLAADPAPDLVVEDQLHGDVFEGLGHATGHGTHSHKDWTQPRLAGAVPRHCDDSTGRRRAAI